MLMPTVAVAQLQPGSTAGTIGKAGKSISVGAADRQNCKG
jgi:hypothetical protein